MRFRIRKCQYFAKYRTGETKNEYTWYEVDRRGLFGWVPVVEWIGYYDTFEKEIVKFTLERAKAYIEKELARPIDVYRECSVIGEYGDNKGEDSE